MATKAKKVETKTEKEVKKVVVKKTPVVKKEANVKKTEVIVA